MLRYTIELKTFQILKRALEAVSREAPIGHRVPVATSNALFFV